MQSGTEHRKVDGQRLLFASSSHLVLPNDVEFIETNAHFLSAANKDGALLTCDSDKQAQ